MKSLPPEAKTRLAEIMGPPLLLPSEEKGGELVTIYPRSDWAALRRFRKNWNVNEIEAQPPQLLPSEVVHREGRIGEEDKQNELSSGYMGVDC